MLPLAVAACVTTAALERDLQGQVGRPLAEVIQAIGIPTEERLVDGRRLLFWRNSFTSLVASPVTPAYGVFGPWAYAGSTSVTYACELAFAVDGDDIIQAVQYQGDLAACGRFLDRLNP